MTHHAGATLEAKAKHAAYNRAWTARNRERSRASKRAQGLRTREATNAARRTAYRLDGRGQRERASRWFHANRDRAAETRRAWRAAHPNESARYRRAWLDEVPLREAAARCAKTANRRARMYDAQGQIGYETVLELWKREPDCVDCGEGRGLDHIVPFFLDGTNTSGNLANRCRYCNSRKGRKLLKAVPA